MVSCAQNWDIGEENIGGGVSQVQIGSVTFKMPTRYSRGDILKVVEYTSLH